MAVVTVKCPSCGKTIQTDDRLEKSFCVYCGSAIYAKQDLPLGIVDEDLAPQPSAPNQQPSSSDGQNSPLDVPISQMTYAQLLEQGQKLQQEAFAQAQGLMKETSNDVALPHGILYAEVSEEEKRNPQKLTVKDYLKSVILPDKKFVIFFAVALTMFLVGIIVLTAAFNLVVVGILFALLMCGGLVGAVFFDLTKHRCGKCKTDFKTADIEYEHMRNIDKTDGKGRRLHYRRYRFTIKCPACGKERVFEEDVLLDGGHIDLRRVVGRREEKSFVGKSKWPLLLAFAGATLLGLIFLIVGSVVLSNRDVDPKNYYGTYEITSMSSSAYEQTGLDPNMSLDEMKTYYATDTLFKIEITKNEAILSGLFITDGSYPYSYVQAKNISKKINSPAYTDKDAIVLDRGNSTYYVLYVIQKKPYVFDFAGSGMVLGGDGTQAQTTQTQTNGQGQSASSSTKKLSDYAGYYVISGVDTSHFNYYSEDDYTTILDSTAPENFFTITISNNSIVLGGQYTSMFITEFTDYAFIKANQVANTIDGAENIGLDALALIYYGEYYDLYYLDSHNGHSVLIDQDGFILTKQ